MSDHEADDTTLWIIFSFVGQNWGTAQTCEMPQSQFNQVIQWQIQRDPSYARYYAEAVAEYKVLYAQHGQAAAEYLYRENQLGNPKLPPKLPDVANFVLLEFMRWNVAFGGFRTFQYENYNGWMGGGSYLKKPPPYRALPTLPQAGEGKRGGHE